MRCPKCKCEVGSQKMCPYCGTPMEILERRSSTQDTAFLNKVYRYMRSQDNVIREQGRKLNILLVLACGNLVMTLLVLIALLVQ